MKYCNFINMIVKSREEFAFVPPDEQGIIMHPLLRDKRCLDT